MLDTITQAHIFSSLPSPISLLQQFPSLKMPIDHTGIRVAESDMKTVVAWYEKALKPLGYVKMADFGVAVGFGEEGGHPDWWIGSREQGNNGSHTAFVAKGKSYLL